MNTCYVFIIYSATNFNYDQLLVCSTTIATIQLPVSTIVFQITKQTQLIIHKQNKTNNFKQIMCVQTRKKTEISMKKLPVPQFEKRYTVHTCQRTPESFGR